MSESLNRARLYNAPMTIPFEVDNEQSQILLSGVIASAPLVALAYSYAILTFESNALHAGEKISVACGGHSLDITLDEWGKAEVSLVPFIRNDVQTKGVLDNPLYCDDEAVTQQNDFRGAIDVEITEDGQDPITMSIKYIFGNYAPKGEPVTDVWMDYDANGETWVNIDTASNYTSAGLPNNFEYNWCDVNKIVEDVPSGDFVMPIDSAWFYGKDAILFSTINYHFRYDCRSRNVIKVRWLDANGNINTKKFALAGKSHGASVSNSWQRPHNIKEIVLGYDRGKDEWADIKANETITIGDESLPIKQFDWLKTLASSAVVEVFMNGAWTRCNIGDASMECDPRKAIFSTTLTLIVPTDDVQQF